MYVVAPTPFGPVPTEADSSVGYRRAILRFKGSSFLMSACKCDRQKPSCIVKLKFHGTDTDTDTDFRDAPKSCNFVNVYTIVYHVQYTYTCTRAHPQRTSSRGKARASDKSPRTSRRGSSSGSWRAERAARTKSAR